MVAGDEASRRDVEAWVLGPRALGCDARSLQLAVLAAAGEPVYFVFAALFDWYRRTGGERRVE